MPQARATRGECNDGPQSINQQDHLQKERCTLKSNSKRSSLSIGVRLLVMAMLVLTLMLGAIQTTLARPGAGEPWKGEQFCDLVKNRNHKHSEFQDRG